LDNSEPDNAYEILKNVVTIYKLSQNIPEHLNLHLVPRIRMCRPLPPFSMYSHGMWTTTSILHVLSWHADHSTLS
jgi:hypothetical protein